MKNIKLEEFENEITKFSNYFIKRYFGNNATEIFWVGDDIGGCLCINDYFFNLDDIIGFIKYKYTSAEMFEYYDYTLEQAFNQKKDKVVINIANWKQIKKSRISSK